MALDLRKTDCDAVIDRVQKSFQTDFELATAVRKRRSLGFQTDRDTWVRIEARSFDRLDGQGWGVEATATLQGVAMPSWHQGIAWADHELGAMWRADETDLVTDQPIKPGGILTVLPELSDAWWMTFNSSLDALAKHTTTRQAVTQERLSEAVHRVFPDVETIVDEWAVAHADLAWANLTAPACYFLDWEDWGLAPRGYDAASLWRESLAIPELANRVQRDRAADLTCRSGKIAQLYACAVILHAGSDYAGPHFEPAQAAADELVMELRS